MVKEMTNEKYPSVRDKEISEVRKQKIEENIREGFRKNLLGRELVKFKELKSEEIKDYPNKEFFKVGLSSITDKIWFIDEPEGKIFFRYKKLGYDYGEAVAEGETKGIIERIIDNVEKVKPKNIILIKEEKLTKEKLIEEFERLFQSRSYVNRFEVNIILTNIYDEHDFWYMDGFEPYKNIEDNSFQFSKPYGFLELCGRKVPVFYSRLVPKGITLLFDKNKIGTLLIKKDLHKSIEDAGKFSEDVKEKIIKDIPALTKEELYEKVKILVYEIIGFEIENPNAVVMLKHEIKEEYFL